MNTFKYEFNVNVKEIKKAIKEHYCYDSWGEAMYGNDKQIVDYNICIDNSTEETEYCSAFYRMSIGEDGYWHHDDCCTSYSYDIDFTDRHWKEKLKKAAIKAYEELWEKN